MRFFDWMMRSPLFDEGGGDGGGGGGGGNGEDDKGTPPLAVTLDQIKGLLNETVNGLSAKLEKRLEKLEQKAAPPPPADKKNQPPPVDDKSKTSQQLADERVREAEERLTAMENERKAEKIESQKKELDVEVKSALSEFTWDKDSGGKEIAIEYFKARATRSDDGSLLVGDVPLSRYIKEQVPRAFKGMLAARPVGGSGALQNTNDHAGKNKVDILDIKPGMTKETEAAALTAIRAALDQARAESGL